MSDGEFWEDFFKQAVASVTPSVCVPGALPDPSQYKEIKVIAVGKAAAAMARAVERSWANQRFSGLVVCPYAHQYECGRFEVIEAAHPVPDQNSLIAAQEALAVAAAVGPGDLLLVLLSGGASSLLCAPIDGLALRHKRQITSDLLKAGAAIDDINLVRSYYSKIKAGGLLAQVPKGAEVITLAISDVVGDDPAKIGSGPTYWSVSSEERVRNVFEKYNILVPEINLPLREKPASSGNYSIVANANTMLATAASWLLAKGFQHVDLGRTEQGAAREVARRHAHYIAEYTKEHADTKIAFLSGGELTVKVLGSGTGGPNQEYLLAAMSRLVPGNFSGFAADTDGRDGVGGAAGAFFGPETHAQAFDMCDFDAFLKNNDSYNFFNEISGLFKVDPTLTNVNDVRVILYQPENFSPLTDM